MRSIVEHTIPPVYDRRSRILILGSFPSPKSREQAFYYGNPQNRFWPVLSALLEEPVPQENTEKAQLLLRHRIALWDVLKSCSIEGADDSSILKPVMNDLSPIFKTAEIRAVFATGAKAAAFYRSTWLLRIPLPFFQLPSTSPANRGRYPMERLLEAYRVILPYLSKEEPENQSAETAVQP